MGVARVGSMFGTAVLLAMVGAAPATTAAAPPTTVIKPSFKVAISPEYTTAGESTTFQVTVVNTSPSGNTLGSVKISPPRGFTPPRPAPGSPLRNKTKVKNRSLMLQQVTVKPGKQAHLTVTATAPARCGSGTTLHWSSQAFVGQNGGGTRLGLNGASSHLDVKVLCPDTMACAVGAVACHTSLVTSNSTYTVMSDATSGTLKQTVNVGNQMHCGPYRFKDPNWYDSAVSAPTTSPPTTTPTPIVDTVTYKIRSAKAKGTGFCLGVGYAFTTASGAPARSGSLPNGNPGFIGLLPNCSVAKPPCIASTTQQADGAAKAGFDVLMTIQIPETRDPWGRA